MSEEKQLFKIIPNETFTLEIGEQSFPGFTVESRWNGMTKYTNGNDWVVAVDFSAHRLIDKLFGKEDGGGWAPVLASPKIISAIKLAKEARAGK